MVETRDFPAGIPVVKHMAVTVCFVVHSLSNSWAPNTSLLFYNLYVSTTVRLLIICYLIKGADWLSLNASLGSVKTQISQLRAHS